MSLRFASTGAGATGVFGPTSSATGRRRLPTVALSSLDFALQPDRACFRRLGSWRCCFRAHSRRRTWPQARSRRNGSRHPNLIDSLRPAPSCGERKIRTDQGPIRSIFDSNSSLCARSRFRRRSSAVVGALRFVYHAADLDKAPEATAATAVICAARSRIRSTTTCTSAAIALRNPIAETGEHSLFEAGSAFRWRDLSSRILFMIFVS